MDDRSFLLLRFSIFFGLGLRLPRGPCRGLSDRSLLTGRDTSHDTSLIFDAAVSQTEPEVGDVTAGRHRVPRRNLRNCTTNDGARFHDG